MKMKPQNQLILEVVKPSFTFNSELDQASIKDFYKNDLNFCLNMFEVCLHTVPLEINNLVDASKELDFIAIVTIANKLKSNFNIVGLKDMHSILDCIEEHAKNKSPLVFDLCSIFENKVEDKMALVKSEVIRITQYLKLN